MIYFYNVIWRIIYRWGGNKINNCEGAKNIIYVIFFIFN